MRWPMCHHRTVFKRHPLSFVPPLPLAFVEVGASDQPLLELQPVSCHSLPPFPPAPSPFLSTPSSSSSSLFASSSNPLRSATRACLRFRARHGAIVGPLAHGSDFMMLRHPVGLVSCLNDLERLAGDIILIRFTPIWQVKTCACIIISSFIHAMARAFCGRLCVGLSG